MKSSFYTLLGKTAVVLLACVVIVGCGSSGHQDQNAAAEAKSLDEPPPEPDALFTKAQKAAPGDRLESSSEYVHIKVYPSYDRIHPGMELKIVLDLTIKAGWHINSHSPHDAYLIPTTVDLGPDSPFKLTSVLFPEPLEIKLKFSEMPVSVFEGGVLIGGVIQIPEDTVLGKYEIPLALKYQACDDATCLAPETLEVKIPLVVVNLQTPLTKINTEIFAYSSFSSFFLALSRADWKVLFSGSSSRAFFKAAAALSWTPFAW